MELKTTSQVVQTLKISRSNLYMLFSRYPALRPALRRKSGGYQWTEGEIERLLTHLSTHKRGRPQQKSRQPSGA